MTTDTALLVALALILLAGLTWLTVFCVKRHRKRRRAAERAAKARAAEVAEVAAKVKAEKRAQLFCVALSHISGLASFEADLLSRAPEARDQLGAVVDRYVQWATQEVDGW